MVKWLGGGRPANYYAIWRIHTIFRSEYANTLRICQNTLFTTHAIVNPTNSQHTQ